ncbi:MAG: hypothetical protein I8H87_13545 [Comamonadaceae bacterium]|nr:hypothetical protein [Comamonadaceae bacterium]
MDTTLRVTARKEEQRSMTHPALCWRVHSALTHAVNPIRGHQRLIA